MQRYLLVDKFGGSFGQDTLIRFRVALKEIFVKHVAASCLVAIFSCLAPAQVLVYDNTGASTNGSDSVQDFGPLYDSFTSTVTGALSDVQLLLSGDNTSLGSVNLGLYADSLASPAALIANLDTLPDSSLGSPLALFNFSLTAQPPLTAGTRYWIGLSGATSADWGWSDDISGIGVGSEFVSNASGTYANDSSGPYQMSVTVSPIESSPEPSSGILLAVGVGLLGLPAGRNWMARLSTRSAEKFPG
jgi:hypothetical protein